MNKWAKVALWTTGFIASGILLSPLMGTIQNTIGGIGGGGGLFSGNTE